MFRFVEDALRESQQESCRKEFCLGLEHLVGNRSRLALDVDSDFGLVVGILWCPGRVRTRISFSTSCEQSSTEDELAVFPIVCRCVLFVGVVVDSDPLGAALLLW